jgi:hypothetical protein
VERKWWTLLASCIAIFMLLLGESPASEAFRRRFVGVSIS